MFVNQDGYYLAYEVRIVNSIPRMQDIYLSVLPRDINVLETSVFNWQLFVFINSMVGYGKRSFA